MNIKKRGNYPLFFCTHLQGTKIECYLFFVEEAMTDLINCDFRLLE